MDHLIGQRFALISKSEIRYVGTLYEIKPEEGTIALEDVVSYGTEDRPSQTFVPPSNQRFDFIKFKGQDVKDIKSIEESEAPKPEPQQMPNDPAILNSSRPSQPQHERRESPFHQPGYPQQGFPPYPPPQFGRGYGPGPGPPGGFGPGPGFGPYGPPPPGYYGPPGQGFPPQFQGPRPPPIGPTGQQHPLPPSQNQETHAPPPSRPTQELPVDNKDAVAKPAPAKPVPTQPSQSTAPPQAPAAIPTGPKTVPRGKVAPAMPFTVNQKSFTPPVQPEVAQAAPKQAQNKSEMDEAAARAKAAVQAALAKMPGAAPPRTVPAPVAPSVETITAKVADMTTSTNGAPRGRGGNRGQRGDYPRGRAGGPAGRKIEIPKSDYDFQSANEKFNKEDLVKEAIASGSPVAENGPSDAADLGESLERKDSIPAVGKVYNKSSSFFDNISSEAKDREDNVDGRQLARQARADEFKRNVDTFGQGNVDGGYRGRGRGGYRGRQYGGSRGYRGGRGQGRGGRAGQDVTNAPPTTVSSVQS